MSDTKGTGDRREHHRSNIKDEVFFVYGDDFIGIGFPLDISSGGLAFRYFSEGRETSGLSSIDVYMMDDPLGHVMELLCRTVYDHSTEPFAHNLTYRRCGVVFVDLCPDRLARLDAFLRQYTITG